MLRTYFLHLKATAQILGCIVLLLYPVDLLDQSLSTNHWLDQTGITQLHALGLSGKGINVALIDSGVPPHHDQLANLNIVKSINTTLNSSLPPTDIVGHSTQVIGVLSSSLFGVAPNINLTIIKAGDDLFYERDRAKAILKVANNSAIKLLLLNIGGGESKIKDEFFALLKYSRNKKIKAVVMPAGNGGGPIPVIPAIYANVLYKNSIVVGALDKQGKIADFSNRAGAIKNRYVLAPGTDISTIDLHNTYKTVSGTSFAAPIVTGAIALLMEAFPDIEPAVILDYLFQSSTDMGGVGIDETHGNGRINAYKTYLLLAKLH